MKKLLTLAAFTVLLALGMFQPQRATAQVTGFVQSGIVDSFQVYCALPAYRNFYAHAGVQGTIPPLDSITVYVNWGDASDTTYKIPTQPSIYTFHNHTYVSAGTYTAQVIYTATSGVADTMYTIPFVATNSCANVNGRLYVDNNANCIFDGGDVAFPWSTVKITNTTTMYVYYSWTDASGEYNIDLPTGFTYNIEKASIDPSYTPSCPVSGVQTVTVAAGPYTEDLGYDCAASTYIDMGIAAAAWSFRPGFDRLLYVSGYSDNYCIPANTTVTLTLDPQLTYTSTLYGTPPTTVAGNVLTWTVTGMTAFSNLIADIYVYCDPAAVIGDTLCNVLTIDTAAGYPDSNMANNTFTLCAPVSNACDPNTKEVSPKGTGAQGYIPAGTKLSYLVNFQNTGNDTAYTVTVKDTLDADVDVNSVAFVSSSHPVTISTLPGNVLVFRFDNIMLPDSNVNEKASHGFVSYTIDSKTGLSPLTTINNTANIYFDFNEAVVTNTTLNTIAPLSVQRLTNGSMSASVYPNPANSQLNVEMTGKFAITVYDLLGRPIATQNANDKAAINTSAMPQGTYMLKISNGAGEMTTRINILH